VYDPLTSTFFGPAWHNWRLTVMPWVGTKHTLEIACGTGELMYELSRRATLVTGVDRSPSMLGSASRKLLPQNVSLAVADALRLPFRDASFDTVVSTFPASFIASAGVLNEVARVLEPGGYFVVVVSARFTRFQWRRPFIHPVLRLAYGSSSSMNRWPEELLSHPRMPGEWQDLPTREGEAFVWIARRVDD
jgi:ubiquinone/menaquinone biosynthesis C-methylase UbiE